MFWLCKRTAAAIKDPGNAGPQRAEIGPNNLSGELRSA